MLGPGTNNVVRYVKEFCSWYYKYFIFAHIHTHVQKKYTCIYTDIELGSSFRCVQRPHLSGGLGSIIWGGSVGIE